MHPQPSPSSRVRAARAYWTLLFILTAAGVASLPLPFKSPASGTDENRALATLPGWPATLGDVRRWTRRFETYMQDAFPGREGLIAVGHTLLWHWRSLRTYMVLEGKEEWLFLRNHFQTLDKTRGLFQLSGEATARWVTRYQQVEAELAKSGILLRLVVIPEKHTVYSEYLPDWARPRMAGPRGIPDQIVGELSRRGVDGVLDLRPVFIARRHERQLFYRTDSHWNPAGAILALETLLPWLYPDHSEKVQDVLSRCWIKSTGETLRGDLVNLLGVPGFRGEEENFLVLCEPRAIASGEWRTLWGVESPLRTRHEDGVPGKTLVLGDSFLNSSWVAIAEAGVETSFFSHRHMEISRSMLARERPGVVLVMINERFLPEEGPRLTP